MFCSGYIATLCVFDTFFKRIGALVELLALGWPLACVVLEVVVALFLGTLSEALVFPVWVGYSALSELNDLCERVLCCVGPLCVGMVGCCCLSFCVGVGLGVVLAVVRLAWFQYCCLTQVVDASGI